MARLWRSSLSRFFCYTAFDSSSPSSSFLASTFHRRNMSSAKEHRRNIWIMGDKIRSIRRLEVDLDHLLEYSDYEQKKYYFKPDLDEIRRDQLMDSVNEMVRIVKGKRPDVNYFRWKHRQYNILHTPGPASDLKLYKVDNALRSAIDGAILVLCSVDGVKRKSIMLDKQMLRYEHPRLVFIQNLRRKGANPWEVLNQARSKLGHCSAAVQVPVGLEKDFKGLVDLVHLKYYRLCGSFGSSEFYCDYEIPANMEALVSEKRRELIETVSKVDDKLAKAFCSGKRITGAALKKAARRATIARKFIPVYMGGNVFHYNKGLLLLLEGVSDYFPSTVEASNNAFDQFKYGQKVSPQPKHFFLLH